MATNKVPKHDFAPAWLKIPDQDANKPGGPKSADHGDMKNGRPGRRDDYYNSYNRYGGPEYPYAPLQRQHSFDNYYDDRRYSPQKFRHHSVDDDYYSATYGPYPYYNGYGYDKYGPHYRSQPTLYRDGKYQHPNARYGNPMNGAYPPYYDPYYDYYHNDPYYGYMRPPSSSRRSFSEKDSGRFSSKHDKDKDKDSKSSDGGAEGGRKASIDEDFPSLNGDAESAERAKIVPQGVWDGHPRESSRMYKATVPSKILTRNTSRDSIKLSGKDINSNGPVKPPTQSSAYTTKSGPKESDRETAKTSPNTKEGNSQSSTPPIEIQSTRLMTKNPCEQKSHHLKTAGFDRPCNGVDDDNDDRLMGRHGDEKKPEEDRLATSVNKLSVSPDDRILSSSLEAEQRLLREMGWNEADEEEYVITEDDMKEFHNLSKQMKDKRNGLTRTLPPVWSPPRVAPYQPFVQDLNDTLSSTSDESDTDAD